MSTAAIDYDALAAQHGGTAVGAPAVDYDALAAQHGGTAVQAQHDFSSLLHNPKGEGTYKVTTKDGQSLDVPYSNVPVFTQGLAGTGFATPAEQARFEQDAAADPKRPTFWNALTNPVGSGGMEGVPGAVAQAGGRAINDLTVRGAQAAAQAITHPIDTLKGAAKGAAYMGGRAFGAPMPEEWNPVTPMVQGVENDYRQGGLPLAAGNVAGDAIAAIEGGRLAPPPAAALFRSAGAGLSSTGEALAESAMGIRNVDRAFDANPGRAALEHTSGLRPSTVAADAQQRLNDLVLERAQIAQANPGPVDFSPARQIASDAMQEQALRNAIPQIDRMAPLSEQILTTGEPRGGWPVGVRPVRPAGVGIPPYVETPEALNLREGVGNYAADKPWTGKASADPLRGMVRGMYGSMSDSLHTAVPEIAPLDEQMHDLIPVAQRAAETDLNASTLQRVAGRFGRPTGALLGAVSGAAGGHITAGLPGALAGGAAGLLTPEVLASPAVQMAIARALYGAGKTADAAALPMGAAARYAVPAAVVGGEGEDPHTGPLGQPNYYSDLYLREHGLR